MKTSTDRKPVKPVRIKICGLQRPEDIRIVNEVLPEYAGFILAEGRKRTVTPEKMAELAAGLDRRILRVAVFLDQDPEWICSLAEQGLMDVIQLHGSESVDVIRMIRARTGKKVIKALRVDIPAKTRTTAGSMAETAGGLAKTAGSLTKETDGAAGNAAAQRQSEDLARRAEICPADLILLDHGAGGSGEAFDWLLAGRVRRDFMLAGGLTPENVREAIDMAKPVAVDVSSGVETDHVKDAVKVRLFVKAVREYAEKAKQKSKE